jgi:hypothetical protein
MSVSEIEQMLRQLQGTDGEAKARAALARFRREGLDAARSGRDRQDKERLVEEARVRLQMRLRELLGG